MPPSLHEELPDAIAKILKNEKTGAPGAGQALDKNVFMVYTISYIITTIVILIE